jgi:hypothetical protein
MTASLLGSLGLCTESTKKCYTQRRTINGVIKSGGLSFAASHSHSYDHPREREMVFLGRLEAFSN